MKCFANKGTGISALKLSALLGLAAAIQLAGADLALAQGGGGSGAFAPLQTAVQMIVDFITGPFGRLLAIIAVIGLGFLAFAAPLVIGLTRSPTLWGVPYMAVVIIVGVTIIGWLASNSLWALLVAPAAYLVLFSLCAWDSRILDVLQVASRMTPRTRNKTFWGTNSYGP